jgi:hypothetical protein
MLEYSTVGISYFRGIYGRRYVFPSVIHGAKPYDFVISKKASEKSLLGFFNKDFSKRSAYDPRTSASEKLLF